MNRLGSQILPNAAGPITNAESAILEVARGICMLPDGQPKIVFNGRHRRRDRKKRTIRAEGIGKTASCRSRRTGRQAWRVEGSGCQARDRIAMAPASSQNRSRQWQPLGSVLRRRVLCVALSRSGSHHTRRPCVGSVRRSRHSRNRFFSAIVPKKNRGLAIHDIFGPPKHLRRMIVSDFCVWSA